MKDHMTLWGHCMKVRWEGDMEETVLADLMVKSLRPGSICRFFKYPLTSLGNS